MSRVTELEKALTTLFRKGTEVGYTETEIDEFLENIDYHALLQAVWNKAETVYAYRADGKNALSLDYRSSELFKQRATLLYEDVGDSYRAAEWMKDSEKNATGCATWYYRYSVALMYCGRLEEALEYAERGAKEEPDYIGAVFAARSMELWLLEDMFKTSSLAKSVFNAH